MALLVEAVKFLLRAVHVATRLLRYVPQYLGQTLLVARMRAIRATNNGSEHIALCRGLPLLIFVIEVPRGVILLGCLGFGLAAIGDLHDLSFCLATRGKEPQIRG